MCLTVNYTVCTTSVSPVRWANQRGGGGKAGRPIFYRETVPVRGQTLSFWMKGKKYGRTRIIGGEKPAEGVNLEEVITTESELQQYYCKQV